MSTILIRTTPLRTFKGHEKIVTAVAVFPDRRRMVTGSRDKTVHLWDLKTGVVLKKMEGHRNGVRALAVSRDGQIIASGDANGEVIVWNGETGESLTQPIKAHFDNIDSLDFSADGTVLATGSNDNAVKFWCTKTWQQQGDPIAADRPVSRVRYSPSGELLAIATSSNIQIYNSSTRKRVATLDVSFSTLAWMPDGTRLLSAAGNDVIQEWDTSTWKKVGGPWETRFVNAIAINPAGTLVAFTCSDKLVRLWRLSDRRIIAIFQHSSELTCITFSVDGKHVLSGGHDNQIPEWEVPTGVHSKILDITPARHSCITGDLSTAEQLLTQEIDNDANDYTSYAHRSFVMARKQDWDHAFEDAIKSISIQPSLTGYISKGIALCGKGQVRDARVAFDVASVFANRDSDTIHFLLLIKAIALFNADQHEEAMLLIKELLAACPNSGARACHVVDAYLRVQLGMKALDGARHDEAVDHFTAAVNSSAFPSKSIHEIYEDLAVLFGWDLESFWFSAHQKRCQAFLSAGRVEEALESHKYMMDIIDETAKASCLDWSNEFKKQCNAHDDRILGAEIPGQDQDGYDAEPDFFRGTHGHSQISRPRPQQRPGRLKKLRLAMTRSSHPGPSPPPPPPTIAAQPPVPSEPRSQALLNRLSSFLRTPPNADEVSEFPQPPMLSRSRPQVLLGHLTSLLPRSRIHTDEVIEPQQRPTPSGSRPGALISSLSSRSPPNADEEVELQQRPRQITSPHSSPHVVEVAAQRDKKALYVARRPKTASENAKRIKNPKPWVRVVMFICCVSPGTDGTPRTA